MRKLSVIVPLYNSEKYIKNTLNSLQKTTYENVEFIVIDDGSTDGSAAIVKEHQALDDRIIYEKIPNGGPGNARNKGIALSTGEYIAFCDSDDLPDEKMYEVLISYMEELDADMALCDIYSERDSRQFGIPFSDKSLISTYSLIELMIGNKTDSDSSQVMWGSVCRCIFKKENILKECIEMPTDISFAEDLIFTLKYLRSTKSAAICDKPLYFYTNNYGSIMNSHFSYKHGMFEARKKLISYLESVIHSLPNSAELHKRLLVTKRCYYQECIGNACRLSEDRSNSDVKLELSAILNDRDVRTAFKHFSVKNAKKYLAYCMIKYRMKNSLMLYYKIRFR